MSEERKVPGPTELIYLPGPSWTPPFAAAGIALVVLGLYSGWVYSVAGAVFLIAALWSWINHTADEISRRPREQKPASAVLPAVPLRRPASDDE